MSDSLKDVPRERVVPPGLLRFLGIASALTGVVLLAAGVFDNAGKAESGGLATIAIGLVMLIASLALLAPIAVSRGHRRELPLASEKQQPIDPKPRDR